MARPQALTPELASQVAAAVALGCSNDDAAGALGVHRSTFYRWTQRGRAAAEGRLRGEPYAEGDEFLADFYEDIEKARYEAKVEALRTIRRGIRGWDETRVKEVEKLNDQGVLVIVSRETITTHRIDMNIALEWLSRRYPQEFARILRQELSGPGGGAISIEERARSIAEEAEKYLEREAVAEAAPETP